jgi:hypothetical protein
LAYSPVGEAKHRMGPIKTVSARETEAHATLFSQTTFYFAKKETSQNFIFYTNTSKILRKLLHTHLISNEKSLHFSHTSALKKQQHTI